MYHLTKTDIQHIIYGAALLGSGGGGGLQMALEFWSALDDDISVTVLEKADVAGKAGCVVAFIGSPNSGVVDVAPILDAFDSQNALHGGALSVVVPVEVGPVNSLAPILVAAKKGLPVVDADGAGRAVPELTMLTFASNLAISPIVLTNGRNANTTVYVDTPQLAEEMLRPIVSAKEFGGFGGLSCWTMTGAQLQANAFWGTLSQARDLGAVILAGTTVQGIVGYLSTLRDGGPAKVLAVGTAHPGPTITAGGFDLGSCGVSLLDGSLTTIFIQNENLTVWNNSGQEHYAPLLFAPDLICYWDNATNRPFTNVELPAHDNKSVTIIGVPRLAELANFPATLAGYQAGLENLGYAGLFK